MYPGSLALLRDAGAYDVLLAQVDLSQHRGAHDEEWCSLIVRALADVVEGTEIVPVVTSVGAVDPPPAIAQMAWERDVALLRGTREGLRAIAAVAGWRPRPPLAAAERRPVATGDPLPAGALPEHDSCALLEGYGVSVSAARALRDPGRGGRGLRAPRRPRRRQGGRACAQAGRAAASRSASASPAEAREAAARMGGRVLVARQVAAGIEAFCGMTRDPDYGPVLAVGLGGRAIEALGLAAVALAPLTEDGARALVAEAPGVAQLASPARSMRSPARCWRSRAWRSSARRSTRWTSIRSYSARTARSPSTRSSS